MEKFKSYETWIYVFIAYLFSFGLRILWVYHFADFEAFKWHGQLMINTNDGYFWASGAKNLFNHELFNNMRVPGVEYGLVYFTYIIAKILPFSLDTIILYMPAFVSSLIVIPIILIMKLYDKVILGFFAALLASITWSFYNRTMIGYYDTDLFALVFPAFIVYYLIKSVRYEKLNFLIIAMLLNSLYFYAYDASKPVVYGIGIGYILYCFIFLRKSNYVYDFIFLISISMLDIDWKYRLVLIFVSIFVVYKRVLHTKKIQMLVAFLSIVLFLYFNNVFGIIWGKIYEYIATGVADSDGLKFYQVHQTIREAGKIPFETFANRILGSQINFILGVIGYIILVFKKKEFLLFLPLVGIGFFAYIGGLRFTVYAIPAMALGAVYLFYFIFDKFIHNEVTRNIFVGFVTLALLYPNIQHIRGYLVPTVFVHDEVKVLDKLKNISNPQDYTLTWWDYGYPIWYYSETNTLIDGGKHQNDNYIISKILLSDYQTLSANLSRLSVEEYVKNKLVSSAVANIVFEKHKHNIDNFLKSLKSKDFNLPKKTRDIYLYLPNRMMNILPTVDLFSNIDLQTGNKKYNTFFYVAKNFRENSQVLDLGNGILLNKNGGILRVGNNIIPLNSLIVTVYDKNGKLHIQKKSLHPLANLYMIYMKSYNQILVMDARIFNSTYIQLFVLENYDKNLFEPVIMTPLVKVFRLRK